jgi:hypothetical protein
MLEIKALSRYSLVGCVHTDIRKGNMEWLKHQSPDNQTRQMQEEKIKF